MTTMRVEEEKPFSLDLKSLESGVWELSLQRAHSAHGYALPGGALPGAAPFEPSNHIDRLAPKKFSSFLIGAKPPSLARSGGAILGTGCMVPQPFSCWRSRSYPGCRAITDDPRYLGYKTPTWGFVGVLHAVLVLHLQ
jgi:hypothetical protein